MIAEDRSVSGQQFGADCVFEPTSGRKPAPSTSEIRPLFSGRGAAYCLSLNMPALFLSRRATRRSTSGMGFIFPRIARTARKRCTRVGSEYTSP